MTTNDELWNWTGHTLRKENAIVAHTRTKETGKTKEKLAQNNTRGSLGCWEDMRRN
jgi:hypothetical protein